MRPWIPAVTATLLFFTIPPVQEPEVIVGYSIFESEWAYPEYPALFMKQIPPDGEYGETIPRGFVEEYPDEDFLLGIAPTNGVRNCYQAATDYASGVQSEMTPKACEPAGGCHN
jgi:hypothetical protein